MMMKKLLGTAFMALVMLTLPASALAQQKETKMKEARKGRTECRMARACDSVSCSENTGLCEFEGIQLTDAQKSKLQSLKKSRRDAMKACKDSVKADRKAEKEARRAEKQARKEKAQAERRAYLKQVKDIIGQENYVIFLENQYVQSVNGPGKHNGLGISHKEMKHKKGPRLHGNIMKKGKAMKGSKFNKKAKRANIENDAQRG